MWFEGCGQASSRVKTRGMLGNGCRFMFRRNFRSGYITLDRIFLLISADYMEQHELQKYIEAFLELI